MKNSKLQNVQGCTFCSDGIRAASAINARRTKSTPAGVFCTLLASAERTGMSVKLSRSEICVLYTNLVVEQLYKDVQLLNKANRLG